MKGQRVTQPTLAHPRDRARLYPSRRRILAAPGFGTAVNQLDLSTRSASPAHSLRPRLAPIPGSGRNESSVLIWYRTWNHILYQPPAIATDFHYQANLIARPRLFGSKMEGISWQKVDKEPMLFFRIRPNTWIPVPIGTELFA